MIIIHHAPGTRGFRLVWLCEELALPYALEKVDFSGEYRASPQWRSKNPVGKVPVMEGGALSMFESGAMVQYLLERYGNGRLQPARDDIAYGKFLQWCWFAEATFERATGEIANHKRAFCAAPRHDVIEEMRERARFCMQAVNQALADNAYLAGGAFTAADIMMGYTLQSFTRHVGDVYPAHVSAYWKRLEERPGYQAPVAAERRL